MVNVSIDSIVNYMSETRITNNWLLFNTMIALLFIQGMILVLNDLIIPELKQKLHLNYTHIMLIQFSFFVAYFVISLPVTMLINKVKHKNGLLIGLSLIIIGNFILIWSAITLNFSRLLIGLFILASGCVTLEIDINVILTYLGSPQTTSSRLTLAHAFTALGTIATPPLFASTIVSGQLSRPYMIGAGFCVLVLLIIYHISFNQLTQNMTHLQKPFCQSIKPPWKKKLFWQGLLAIFAYMGGEIAVGSLAINYLRLAKIVNFTLDQATKYLIIYWGGLMIGRFIGSYILTKIPSTSLLIITAMINNILLCFVILGHGYLAMYALLLLGFFNSTMYPTIFSLHTYDINDLANKNKASAFFSMASIGGAIIPLAQGKLADMIGLQHSFILLILCYTIIIFYGYTHPLNKTSIA